ncbi:MAG: ATP-binding cassette domain-containing protein [Anaerolineales bacterium]
MAILQVSHIHKSFGKVKAVNDVSFEVQPGDVFALLGPNGAGKTTTIRIALDLFRPESGTVSILGGAMTEGKKARVGYMPEERGLYQDVMLERVLLYLANLKGLQGSEAKKRLDAYLERFDLAEHRRKKVKELSKGMQQKAQIIATIIHEPELLIVDEPFSGLDPVNTRLVKDVLREMHAKGTTVIMSAHQMNQVEEMCERLVLIHRGEVVLYGNLRDIRRQFAGHAALVEVQGDLPPLPGIKAQSATRDGIRLDLEESVTPQEVLSALMASGVTIDKFQIAIPTLEEIFVKVVGGNIDLNSNGNGNGAN